MPEELIATGLAKKAMVASVSAAAAYARESEITANPGHHEINVQPTSTPDQGNLPCCVSCSLAAALETLNASNPALSALFHYHVTRYDHGLSDSEGFISIDDGFSTIRANGICRLDLHDPAFTDSGMAITPSSEAYSDGRTRAWLRSPHYRTPDSLSRAAWARSQILNNLPVVIGFRLPASYPNDFLDANLEWADPSRFPDGANLHCVIAVAFDDVRRCLQIQDWRGDSSFDQGRWWMGYTVMDSTVVQDVYSLFP